MTIILGADGRPLDLRSLQPRLEEPQTAQLGPIRNEFGGHPARNLTPARLATLMQRGEEGDLARQAELAEDMMERDGHLAAEMAKRTGAITQLAWSIEPPPKPTPEEEALTERVRDWMSLLTAHGDEVDGGVDVLLLLMSVGVIHGFAPIEMTWPLRTDARGRQVRIPDCQLQPHSWFTISGDRRRLVLRSSSKMLPAGPDGTPAVMGEELRQLAWLMHVHPARLGYVGRQPLARVLFWPYLFKNFAVRDFAEFLEIYGLPLRLGKYPAGAGDDEKRALLQAVTQIGHNAAGIVPAGMAIDFQAAAAGTDAPFGAMWDRMDAVQSKVILGQTLSASEGQHGTQALGQVHNEVRHDIRDADARQMERSINAQVLQPMVALNEPGIDPRRAPRFMLDTGDAEDMAAYADNLPKLAKAGLRIGVNWVHEKLRIPKADDGEEVLGGGEPEPEPAQLPPGAVPPGPPKAKKPDPKAALTGALPEEGPPADLIDELVAEQVTQWAPLLGPMVEPLLAEMQKAVAAGETLEAFAARIPDLVGQLDAHAVTTAIAQAAFAARLAGEAGRDLDP